MNHAMCLAHVKTNAQIKKKLIKEKKTDLLPLGFSA